jgi:hypothetical protein
MFVCSGYGRLWCKSKDQRKSKAMIVPAQR